MDIVSVVRENFNLSVAVVVVLFVVDGDVVYYGSMAVYVRNKMAGRIDIRDMALLP